MIKISNIREKLTTIQINIQELEISASRISHVIIWFVRYSSAILLVITSDALYMNNISKLKNGVERINHNSME